MLRKYFLAFLATFAAITLLPEARADGQSSFEKDALRLLRRNPGLLKIVQQTLDVEPFGHGAGGFSSATPFEFRARLKGQGGDFTLILIINDSEFGLPATADSVCIEIHPFPRRKP